LQQTPLAERRHLTATLAPTATRSLTALAGGLAADDPITLTVAGAPAWLTVPETCFKNAAFDVVADAADVLPGEYAATITASYAGYDDATCLVRLVVSPENYPHRRRSR
jgi:hypothetical protein